MQNQAIDVTDTFPPRKVGKTWQKSLQEWLTALAMCLMVVAAGPVLADAGDELGDGICKVVNILTGKWLFGGAVLATIGGLVGIIFGGEISDGIKKVATIVTILGLCVGIPGILAFAFKKFSGQTC